MRALQKPDHLRRAHHAVGFRFDGGKIAAKAADIANGVAQAFIDYSLAQKQKILLQAQGWNEK